MIRDVSVEGSMLWLGRLALLEWSISMAISWASAVVMVVDRSWFWFWLNVECGM